MFQFLTANVTSNLALEGSTFSGFGHSGLGGPIFYVYGVGADVRVDGGAAGVTFSNNRGIGDAGGVGSVYFGNLTFNGKTTFDSNWTGSYGGALSVYQAKNSLAFNGDTTFKNNHAVVFGGAIDVWGGESSVTFDGPSTTFDGNYVHYIDGFDVDHPIHVTDQNPRGGAINIGYVDPGVEGASLVFNAPTTFTNNYVVSTGANKNALGGAISVYGNLTPKLYRLTFNNSALFQGNYVYAIGANLGNGGAIYYDSSAAIINLSSGTQFLNNYAKTYGGAIYLQSGTINLNASAADITFQGNRHGVGFDGSYKPIIGSGTPNAIYLGSSGSLNLITSAGRTINFYDPIASVAGSTVAVTKSGSGEAIFHGDNGATSLYDSLIQGTTLVQGGTFTLADGVKYGSTTAGTTFRTQATGTVRGGAGGELRANSFLVETGGALGVTGGTFIVNSPSITLQNGTYLNGYGTLNATSNINLLGTVTADIAATRTLNVARLMTGAGGVSKTGAGTLTLSAANAYTGATTISGGTLSAGAANIFANSSAVTVGSSGALALNNYAQTAQNLSGGGGITLGSATLTANNTVNTTFSGGISGTGRLIKGGTGNLTLSGSSNYSGGTTISGGRLIATNGAALGLGTVSNSGTLELAFAGGASMANQLTGTGAVEKTGAGTLTLTNANSSVGALSVKGGTLFLNESGTFNATTYSTELGAATSIGTNAKLVVGGAFTQAGGSTLNVGVGATNNPAITANSATIGGALNVSGYIATFPLQASQLNTSQFAILKSTNAIAGDFSSVNFSDFTSPVDYLTLGGGKSADNLNYSVGLGLTWLAGTQKGNGIFTLANAADAFNVDVVLGNQAGSATGWNGTSLTKNGAGNLTLSAVNTYTGATTINNGTLTTGAANVFAQSGAVAVDSSATLALGGGHAQTAQNLSGGGTITLGSATLTANNTANTIFSGGVSGTGGLVKGGANNLTLSGSSNYSGGTIISGGRLIATNGAALGLGTVSPTTGTLELAFAANGTLSNRLNGSGTVEKTGTGTVTLNNANSSVGTMNVKTGNLTLAQNGAFSAGTYTTELGATTTIGSASKLAVSGAFTQAGGSILTVGVGASNSPAITAGSATIGGTLSVSGLNTTQSSKASDLIAQQFTVLQSGSAINGDFSSVNFGGASASVDYLTLGGGKSANNLSYSVGLGLTWLAGTQKGNGIFTLANAADAFNVDVVLGNQAPSATTGWNGTSLTKNGLGNLTLSAVNTYTGATTINNGTLTTGAANVFAQSGAVTVNSGATLALGGGYAQTAQNLSGGGTITLGSATLTANNSSNTTFSGGISGAGNLIKDGAGDLTLSGTTNTYSGGTTISDGRLIATNGAALGSGTVSNASTLELAFAASGTLSNQLTGGGTVEKTGTNTVTLNNANSSVGAMDVKTGNLTLAQNGAFTAGNYTTQGGATTTIGSASTLAVGGAFTQAGGSALVVGIGANNNPAITAGSAAIGGALSVSGLNTTQPLKASDLIGKQFTVLQSGSAINGDFSSVNFGGASASVDYLTIAGGKSADNLSYSVGMGLAWQAGTQKGNGIFTLANAADAFNVDVVLGDQSPSATTGWNGTSLTKNGLGNLTLSAVNTYTGATTINNGTLTTGAANVFAQSGAVTVNSGATLALGGGYAQTAQNLSGGGTITLGSATLTANNSSNTTFSGGISGAGNLIKDGAGDLTLSGTTNTYSGGTTISDGRLIATNGAALGSGTVSNASTLELAFASDGTLANKLTGSGTIEKTGSGIVTLSNNSSSVGAVDVKAGTLYLDEDGVFTAGTYDIQTGAATTIGTSSSLKINGAFTEAAGGVLNAMIGNNLPMVTADTANLAGDLAIAGFDPALPASVLTATRHVVLHTTGGINGDFNSVRFDGITTGVDYLLLDGEKNSGGNDYSVGFALTWTSGATTGDGTFTLLDPANIFNVDVLLADQTASATGWNGSDLTKKGDGTLILSHQNSYTGETSVEGGVLSLQANLALGETSQLAIDNGATVALNGTSQTVGKLKTEAGSRLEFGGGILTISDAQRVSGDTSGGSIQANTLFGTGGLVVDPSIVEVFGANSLYTGTVTVTGGSQVIMNNASGVGDSGLINLTGADDLLTLGTLGGVSATGTLKKSLAGLGSVQTRSGADITLSGNNGAFSGLFDVGSGTTLRADGAADLGAADIKLAGVLNVTAASNWMMANSVTGNGSFYKDGAGQLLLHGGLKDFSGQTYVTNGVLIVGDATMSGAKIGGSTVTVSTLGTLSGAGTITGNVVNNGTIAALNSLSGYEGAPATGLVTGPLSNAGTIRLAGSNVGNTLTVKGGMTSLNGSVVLNTVLGGDNSLTDRLILDGGATTGLTSLVVQNQGGRGAQTQDGLLLVDAINGATTSSDAFKLSAFSSGYRATTGTLAVGGFDYSLSQGGAGDESWYLSSIMESARPEAGVYLVNREASENMFMHTMRDRLDGFETKVNPLTGEQTPGPAWARMYATKRTSYADDEKLKTNTDVYALQTGLDLLGLSDDSFGAFHAGMMLGKGSGKSDTSALWNNAYRATGDVSGYALGVYGTWFQDANRHSGFYADSWLQHAWFSNDVQGDGLSKEKYDSRMWAASLESGYSFVLKQGEKSSWFLEPSAQLIYLNYSANDFTEEGGTIIHQGDDNKLTTRLGARLYGRFAREDEMTLEPFIQTNWWHANRQDSISMDSNVVYSDAPKDIGELKVGFKASIRENLSFTVDLSTQFADQDYHQYGGQIGVRYQW